MTVESSITETGDDIEYPAQDDGENSLEAGGKSSCYQGSDNGNGVSFPSEDEEMLPPSFGLLVGGRSFKVL